jgi:hypothetical protein
VIPKHNSNSSKVEKKIYVKDLGDEGGIPRDSRFTDINGSTFHTRSDPVKKRTNYKLIFHTNCTHSDACLNYMFI